MSWCVITEDPDPQHRFQCPTFFWVEGINQEIFSALGFIFGSICKKIENLIILTKGAIKKLTKILFSEIMSQLVEVKEFKEVQDLRNIEALREQFRIMESSVAAVVEGKLIYTSELENFLEVNKWGYILCISLKSTNYYQVLVDLLKGWPLMNRYLTFIYVWIYI